VDLKWRSPIAAQQRKAKLHTVKAGNRHILSYEDEKELGDSIHTYVVVEAHSCQVE